MTKNTEDNQPKTASELLTKAMEDQAATRAAPNQLPGPSAMLEIARNMLEIARRRQPLPDPTEALNALANPSRTPEEESTAFETLSRLRSQVQESLSSSIQIKNHLQSMVDVIDQQYPPPPPGPPSIHGGSQITDEAYLSQPRTSHEAVAQKLPGTLTDTNRDQVVPDE